jgi:hypothetical protein
MRRGGSRTCALGLHLHGQWRADAHDDVAPRHGRLPRGGHRLVQRKREAQEGEERPGKPGEAALEACTASTASTSLLS